MPFPWLLVLLVTLDVLDFQLHRSSLSFSCLPVCSHVSSLERTPVIFDCVVFKLLQPCPTLCSPMDCSPPGSSVHGILQQEDWSGLLCPPPGDLPGLGIKPTSCLLHWQVGSLPPVPPCNHYLITISIRIKPWRQSLEEEL